MSFDAPSSGDSSEYTHKPYITSITTTAADSAGLSSFTKIFAMGSEKHMHCAIECVVAVQEHQGSLISVLIESACATSYY